MTNVLLTFIKIPVYTVIGAISGFSVGLPTSMLITYYILNDNPFDESTGLHPHTTVIVPVSIFFGGTFGCIMAVKD